MPRSLHLSEFERDFAALGAKPTHIRRLWRAWLGLASWQSQGHASYPKALQEKLPEIQSELESLARFNVKESQQAESSKLLVMLPDGACVEAVLLPRQALCISTQVGCAVGCAFCMTGKGGLERQLSSAEIAAQYVAATRIKPDIKKVVLMGMGEPFDNLDEVMKALSILTSEWGFAWSPKRITVSTIGHLKGIRRFLDESRCHLAVSLHAPSREERLQIMPVEKAYPIADILDLLRQYDFSHQRRLSFEYILFSGYNDSLRHADALARLLQGVECRVNLIRFHAIPGVNLKSSDPRSMEAFRDRLNSRGIVATIRASRGEDIQAACGLLSTKELQQRK